MSMFIGGNGDNNIAGTGSADYIFGNNGNDKITGGAGDDLIDGGSGNDTISAGVGDDFVLGGNGNDSIDGGVGDDLLLGENGNDTLDGGSGSDLLLGGSGNDLLTYTASENIGAYDIYDGGSGNDVLRLVVSQALANSQAFLQDIARINYQLRHGGRASLAFDSMDLSVLSIEAIQIVIAASGNVAPHAQGDTVSDIEDQTLTITAASLLANDTDANAGDSKSIVSVTSGTGGTASYSEVTGLVSFVPTAGFSGVATFTYTMRDQAGATSNATVTVNVAAVADAPNLTVEAASGNEDTAIALSFSGALADTDGSETLSYRIANLPPGATLTKGTLQSDGSFTLAAADLVDLALNPPEHFSGIINLSVTAISREASNGFTASTTSTLVVNVAAVADAPTLMTWAASGNEDSSIALAISGTLKDIDGSETLSYSIRGLPAGATLNHGTANPDGSYTLSSADLTGLLLNPPADFAGTISLSVTATSLETSNGSTASTISTLAVSMAAVADVPTLTTLAASGSAADTSIDLLIAAGVTDHDGSETISSINISGIPSAYVLSAGTQAEGGDWILTPAQLSGLSLILVESAGAMPGDIQLQVTASSQDGSSTASTSSTLTVSIAPAANQQVGQIIDGYVAGATVFADANFNGLLDAGEVSTKSNADGSFVLTGGTGNIVMFGGVDTSTGSDFLGTMTAPSGSLVVTPLTTLIVQIAGDNPDIAALEAAQTTVRVALGIGSTVDLRTFDAVAAAAGGSVEAASVLAAAVQVQSTVTQISAATAGTPQEVMAALATAITQNPGEVDLTDPQTIIKDVVSTVAPGSTAIDAISAVVSSANGTIVDAVASSGGDALVALGNIAQAAQVALGATTTALTEAAGDSAALATVQTNYTGSALDAQVATATVGDVDGPLLGTAGDDALTGGSGVDAIDGLDGSDVINGAAGNDLMYGGGGRDRLIGGSGTDVIDGGIGIDRVDYSASLEAVAVSLASGTAVGGASVGIDTLISIEGVIGSAFDDSLTGSVHGSRYAEMFEGLGGNDTIHGAGGFDRAIYDGASTGALGINVDLGAGTVTGRDAAAAAVVGTDTLRSIESVRGSNADDLFDATSFTATSTNGGGVGDLGSFNEFEGMGGSDVLTGNGNTRVSYQNATAGVTVTFTGYGVGTATGNGSVGTDTFVSGVTAVRGSAYNDTLTGSSVANNQFETFEGMAGDDLIDGAGGIDRARYDSNSLINVGGALTTGISIDMTNGIVTGRDAAITALYGTDTLRSIESIRGTFSNDMYNAVGFGSASVNAGSNGTFNEFEGLDGDDQITGNGATRVTYGQAGAGITAVLSGAGAGSVTGDSTVGTDTITGGVTTVRGSQFADSYNASAFTNIVGSTFNEFEGQGGNDMVVGNGSTRINFSQASAGVTVTFTAAGTGTSAGTVAGDGAGVGTDTFSGVGQVRGGSFGDVLNGAAGNDNLDGQGGNDTINGGGGVDTLTGSTGNDTIDGGGGVDMAVFAGTLASYTITGITNGATVVGADGADTVTNVEILRFDNAYRMGLTGSSGTPINVSGVGFFNGNGNALFGTNQAGGDFLTIGTNLNGHQIDLLGGGADTLNLAASAPSVFILNLANVETINGSGFADTVSMAAVATNLTIYLGAGSDTLSLANGVNVVTVSGVETLNANNGNDTVTFISDGSLGQTFNMGTGTDVLNLTGAASYQIAVQGGNGVTVNGTAGNETVALTNVQAGVTYDLGGGTDSLTLASSGSFVNVLTVRNVELVTGTDNGDQITIGNTGGTTTVIGGGGGDILTASAGNDQFRFVSASDSGALILGVGSRDIINGFDASQDVFEFSATAFSELESLSYVGTGPLTGQAGEIQLISFGGVDILQVDINGDGAITAMDTEIQLQGLTGTLAAGNFALL